MAEYLEFILLDEKGVERKGKMNKDDPNDVYLWRAKRGDRTLKNPYWKRCAINEALGYYHIKVGKKQYKLHRVCYYAHNPDWNIYDSSRDNSIDHIDRNRTNNHITNLRVATNSQNAENKNAKGYHYCETYKRWRARVTKHGKQYNKYCKTEEEAIEAREKLKEKYHTF